ncbi:MAG: hypothetical protein ACI9YL_000877 [Luteibaculaceae bacterium]|jgi:hypothetical protein
MNTERNEWVEEVFQSMQGSQRIPVPGNLFAKIENQLEESGRTIIPLQIWGSVAAAALVLVAINISALMYYSNSAENTNSVANGTMYESPITNYEIYP